MHKPAPQLPAGEWLSLEEASRRGKLSVARLRNYAKVRYEPLGLAERRRNPHTGKEPWFIHSSAENGRFALLKLAGDRPDELAIEGTDEQRTVASYRLGILQELERRFQENNTRPTPKLRREVVDLFSNHLRDRDIKVSGATLYRWWGAWNDAGRQLHALYPSNVSTPDKGKADYAEYYRQLELLYGQESEPGKEETIRNVTAIARHPEFGGFAVPHPKDAQRYLFKLERERPQWLLKHRGGISALDNHALAYIPRSREIAVERDQQTGKIVRRKLRSNEIWCADHHICDTMVQYDGKLIRPWLTAILDIRSNRIVGRHWSPKAPNSFSVLQAMRDAILRNGMAVPDYWYVDNGKDFDSWMWVGQSKIERKTYRVKMERERMQGLLSDFGIKMIHARPYNAKAKPVERFFGIFEANFGKFTWTYTGRTPQHKPECLADRLKDMNHVPDFAEYAAEAEDWIFQRHHNDPLTSKIDKGKSRDEVYAENLTSIRTTSEAKLDLLVPIRKVKVGRQGVTYRTHQYHDPALVAYFGKEVALRINTADIRSVKVYDLESNRFICRAQSLSLAPYGNVRDDDAKELERRIAEINRVVKAATKLGIETKPTLSRRRLLEVSRRAVSEELARTTPAIAATPDSIRMSGQAIDPQDSPLPDHAVLPLAAGGESLRRDSIVDELLSGFDDFGVEGDE